MEHTKRKCPSLTGNVIGSEGKTVLSNGIGKRSHEPKKTTKSGRYEFEGKGRDLYKARVIAHRLVPKTRFVDVSAKEFLEKPYEYGIEGEWVESTTQS
jgi:hypothetical protein